MKYLLIGFVIFLALAPLSHFVPSKRQRRIARLREYAAVNGLFVEFRRLPGSDDSRGSGRGGEIIYYGLRLPHARGDQQTYYAAWRHYDDGWRGMTTGHRSVPPLLPEMPEQVLAASVEEGSCGIYWAEEGDEQEVDRIVELLRDWSGELRPG